MKAETTKAERTMCRFELRACNKLTGKLVGARLAIAFMLGLLTQYAIGSSCFADESAVKAAESQLVAAMPEEGAPPAPVTSLEAQAGAPKEADKPAASDEPSTNTESSTSTEPVQTTEPPLPSEAATESPTAAEKTAAKSDDAEASSEPSVVHTEVEVRELSVAPESKPLLPAGRPAWVGASPDLSNPRRHRLFVGSFPTSSIEEADAALDEPMLAAVNGYIDEQVLEDGDAEDLNITADFIRHNLLDSSTEYMAELSTSTGPLYQKWVVLEITPEHRKYFADAYRHVEQKKRMVALGLGLAGLLGITGVAHLTFNRRRRRYTETVQPVVHTVLHEPDPDVAQRRSHVLLVLGGCTAFLLVLGLLFMGSVTLVHQSRTTHPMTVHTGPRVNIHGEPPAPPTPPRAPEVYFDQAEFDSMMKEQREARERLREAKAAVEAHERVIQLGSGRD